MRKWIAIVLAALSAFAFVTVALAADTTTLSATVPDATYTLNIPADQEIPFGQSTTEIGTVTVTDTSGFAEGKNVQVTLTYDSSLKADGVSTVIPYYISSKAKISTSGGSYGSGGTDWLDVRQDSGSTLIFKGKSSGSCNEYFELSKSGWGTDYTTEQLCVHIESLDWGKALGGVYSSTITFTAEVVSES